MSSVILTNFTVYYLDETRRKQIIWTGGAATTINTVQELYTALQDLFDESGQMDEGVPMTAQTPTQFSVGLTDTGDADDPWFLDKGTGRHLTGGGLSTAGWTREEDVNCGIVRIERTGSNIVPGDVGSAISNTGYTDTGTLLYVDEDGTHLIIRPTDSSSTHNWNHTDGTILCNGHSDTQSGAATTGENIWANVYTLGTIADNTEIYVVRNGTKITSWWDTGHMDVLIVVQEIGELTDLGILSIYARQYSQLYDHYQLTVNSATRNPIPLSSGDDINNDTGLRTFNGSGGNSNTFESGNGIYVGADWATATRRGILTAEATGATPTLVYYLVGDLTAFTASDAVKEYVVATGIDGDATTTAAAPSDYTSSPGLYTGITFTFGADTYDLDNGNGPQPYDVVINCNSYTLANFYEYTKYVTRRGSDTDLNGLTEGEQYTGTGEIQLDYDTMEVGGEFTEGEIVTGTTSQAEGYITADHYNGDNTGTLVLRTVRGTFEDAEQITDSATADADVSGTATNLSPIKTSPFGTFAGGQFFGARGVYIYNMHGDDGNSYQLTDSLGGTQTPPATVPITVSNTEIGDRISVFRALDTDGTIDKVYLESDASANTVGLSTYTVDSGTTIPTDTPSAGKIRLVDVSTKREHRFRYASWTGLVFTLITAINGSTDSTGGNKVIHDSGASFLSADILSGDLVRNSTDLSWAHVVSVDSDIKITTTALTGGSDDTWTSGDGYSFHTLPVAYENASNVDTAYVPYLDSTATGTSVSTNITFYTTRYISTRVRIKGLQPYTNNITQLTSAGYATTTTRINDTIAT